MSQYYNAQWTRNLFEPKSHEPFKLSRSKLDLFLTCPRCFYLDCRLGVGRPPGFPFNLNSAVDALLKKEFDIHRAKGEAHPLMKAYGIKAIPLAHADLDNWRNNFVGVQYLHAPTNLLITGAVDDIWINAQDEFIVVDYKATSKSEKIVALDQEWQDGYKRQMEIYQWLLRQKGFNVADIGYFVYCNGRRDKAAFDGKLEFDVTLISHQGNTNWVEPAILNAHKCLRQSKVPKAVFDCDYCCYREAAGNS
ncbi:PD-(D/E)XK nuclease family protein [Candidatus Falkowbacteria bacterium]|nr:PD-(D/E)XK nuclease family protein [Candidatus Falkowbacteria bacterium]